MAPTTLTDLPLDLRNNIYEYVITQKSAICPIQCQWLRRANGIRYYHDVPVQPNLALVSRSIRTEVLEVFLMRNNFSLRPCATRYINSEAQLIARWRLLLGERPRHLRHITFVNVFRHPAGTQHGTMFTWMRYDVCLGAGVW